MSPRIVCAAALMDDDAVVIGIRHFDDFMRENMQAGLYTADEVTSQGFVDQYGKYYTRSEAWKVAEKAGQIIRRVGGDDGRLFSENLY